MLRARALQRGALVHRLLQSLPELVRRTPSRRGDAPIWHRNAGWLDR